MDAALYLLIGAGVAFAGRMIWTMSVERRAMLHDLAPGGYFERIPFGPPVATSPLELSFDGWIAAETDQTFGEWIEAAKKAPSPPAFPSNISQLGRPLTPPPSSVTTLCR